MSLFRGRKPLYSEAGFSCTFAVAKVRLAKIAQYIAIFPALRLVAPYLIPPFPPALLRGSYWGMLAEYSVEKCGWDCFFRSKNVDV